MQVIPALSCKNTRRYGRHGNLDTRTSMATSIPLATTATTTTLSALTLSFTAVWLEGNTRCCLKNKKQGCDAVAGVSVAGVSIAGVRRDTCAAAECGDFVMEFTILEAKQI